MLESAESATTSDIAGHGRWLLLIHQLPPRPDYLRVKVRRRLQRIGAVALKNTVYVLPNRDETAEDFHWLLGEIAADGGEATLCAATLVAGISDAEVEALFRADRDAEYAAIARAARSALGAGAMGERGGELARLRRRVEDAGARDFFGAPGRAEAEAAIRAAEAAIAERAAESSGRRDMPDDAAGVAPVVAAPAVRGRTWVTRTGVFVDRMASAWLVRRFIDPEATFKFVSGHGYIPLPGELRFDMYEAEFTHERERCTFETLLARFGLGDPALRAIAEIVHDIDLKDGKFARPETAGVAAVLAGIARAHPADADRIQQGVAIFDGLHAQLGGRRP
ncbi:MAG TPA: chromate resistance protein ChrB domain-containing protein [Gemmatimonadaceae bacterium]|nr:chromate resistance protein ChrB domain-containing protein [Gemmatimonadaceae bacterium]